MSEKKNAIIVDLDRGWVSTFDGFRREPGMSDEDTIIRHVPFNSFKTRDYPLKVPKDCIFTVTPEKEKDGVGNCELKIITGSENNPLFRILDNNLSSRVDELSSELKTVKRENRRLKSKLKEVAEGDSREEANKQKTNHPNRRFNTPIRL